MENVLIKEKVEEDLENGLSIEKVAKEYNTTCGKCCYRGKGL